MSTNWIILAVSVVEILFFISATVGSPKWMIFRWILKWSLFSPQDGARSYTNKVIKLEF